MSMKAHHVGVPRRRRMASVNTYACSSDPQRNPAWHSSSCASICGEIRWKTNRSKILQKHGVKEMGRLFVKQSLDPDLCRGTTTPIFQADGKIDAASTTFMNITREFRHVEEFSAALKHSYGRPSQPGEEPHEQCVRADINSPSEKAVSNIPEPCELERLSLFTRRRTHAKGLAS